MIHDLKNPYPPNDTRHGAFARGVEAAASPQPPTPEMSAVLCGRASAKVMIEMRIGQLRNEIESLEHLAKFAVAMEDTPADAALWKMIINQRS